LRARAIAAALAAACGLSSGCGGAETSVTERLSTALERRPTDGVLTAISFEGEIALDPEAVPTEASGPIWLHLYFLDDLLFDSMTCYGDPDDCAVFDLSADEDGRAFTAALAFDDSTSRPLALRYELGRGQSFTTARTVGLRVFVAPHGEVGSTELRRANGADARDARRARLRARGRLQRAFRLLALRYGDRAPEEAGILGGRPEQPSPPPCHPVHVEDPAAVEWLGLRAPTVVSWAYGITVVEETGTLRITARRDPGCDGELEEVTLEARLDTYDDLVRITDDATAAEQ